MVTYFEREENFFFFWMFSQWNAKRSKSFRVRRSSVYFFSILSYMIEIWQMYTLKVFFFLCILSICHLFPKNAMLILLVSLCRRKEEKEEGNRKIRKRQVYDKHKYCNCFWLSFNPILELPRIPCLKCS